MDKMKAWQAIIVGILVGFPGGVATMQATMIGEVRQNTAKIVFLDRKQTDDMATTEKRIDNIIRLWEASLQSNRELTALVSKQIALLERQNELLIKEKP